jgi:hypothetical protein
MAKSNRALVVIEERFDYTPLEKTVADEVQSAAERIRQSLKRTTDSIIEVGQELIAVKAVLPHGKFGPWLRAEFAWTERTVQNFINVAEHFGPKSEIISDLKIDPTAAYLLSAPSAPDQARQVAIERAEGGEQITAKLAKEILAKERRKPRRRLPGTDTLKEKLAKALIRYRDKWNQKELSELAQQLREFADSLEEEPATKRKKECLPSVAEPNRCDAIIGPCSLQPAVPRSSQGFSASGSRGFP